MLTIIAFTLNKIESIAKRWRIGIGEETCFLKPGKGMDAGAVCPISLVPFRYSSQIVSNYRFRRKSIETFIFLSAALHNMGNKCAVVCVDGTTNYSIAT